VNNKGFTFLEILSVLLIMGVLAVAFVPKLIKVDKKAELHGLKAGVQEINVREKLIWQNFKIGSVTYNDKELDELIKENMDRNISYKYSWNGDTLTFCSISVNLERIPATNKQPAYYKEKF